MTSSTKTLIDALRVLARDIQSYDGVANAAIGEAADRLEQQDERIRRLEQAGDALYENSDPTKWDLWEAANRKLKEQEAWRKAKEAKL